MSLSPRRHCGKLALGLAAALLAAAPARAPASAPVSAWAQPPADARVLHVVAPWEVKGLDPARGGFVFQRLSVAETLVVPDHEGRLRPGLASGWSVSADGLEWRFPLRAGARFQDGTAVTASAVASDLERARQTRGSPLAQVPLGPPPQAGIAAEGDDVVLRLSHPFSVLAAYLADYSTIILAPASYDADGHVTRIIGSGPYRVTRIDASQVVETEAMRAPAEGGPAVQRVEYRAVADGETRARMAEAGDADLALNLQPVAADRLRRNPALEILSLPIPRARFIALNTALPGLSDLPVRQALSLAIDRAGMARALLRNPAAAADQLLPPFLGEWRDPAVAALRYDPAEARHLLDAAGWRPGPDGIRARNGQRLSFELFTYAGRPELPPLAEAVQAQWQAVGVEAKLRLGDSEEIPAMHNAGTLQTALVARNYGLLPDPIGALSEDFLAASTVGYGPAGWSSPQIEAAIAEYMASSDAPRRAALRRQITGIVQGELPVIPLSWYDQVVAVSRQIQGAQIDPFEATYGIAGLRWAK